MIFLGNYSERLQESMKNNCPSEIVIDLGKLSNEFVLSLCENGCYSIYHVARPDHEARFVSHKDLKVEFSAEVGSRKNVIFKPEIIGLSGWSTVSKKIREELGIETVAVSLDDEIVKFNVTPPWLSSRVNIGSIWLLKSERVKMLEKWVQEEMDSWE